MKRLPLDKLTGATVSFLEGEILPLMHSKEYVDDIKKRCAELKEQWGSF